MNIKTEDINNTNMNQIWTTTENKKKATLITCLICVSADFILQK